MKLYNNLPYMEPPYWPYPIRQTLDTLLVLQNKHEHTHSMFTEALTHTPNNTWALYGLHKAYTHDGKPHEAHTISTQASQNLPSHT